MAKAKKKDGNVTLGLAALQEEQAKSQQRYEERIKRIEQAVKDGAQFFGELRKLLADYPSVRFKDANIAWDDSESGETMFALDTLYVDLDGFEVDNVGMVDLSDPVKLKEVLD